MSHGTSTGRTRLATAGADAGVSLVEVMVAMVVFAIGSLSLLSVIVSTTDGGFDNRARLVAANLAASDIDQVRSTPYAEIPEATTTITERVGSRDYTVTRRVALTSAPGSATSACVSTGGIRPLYKRVSTEVTTTSFRGNVAPVRADTLIKAPVYSGTDATKGALGFIVLDRNSNPFSTGPTVQVNGQSTTSDSNGCSFFDGLPVGDHVVTVTRPSSVTRTGRTPMTKTVRIRAKQVTSDSMRIDTAVTVSMIADIRTSSSTPLSPTSWNVPTNLTAHIATPDRDTSTRLQADHAPLVTGSPTVPLTWSAFPAPGGYEGYLGRCSAAPTRSRTDSEPSGATTQLQLSLTPVTVHLYGSGPPGAQGKKVTATWRPTTACTETLAYSAQTRNECNPSSNGAAACTVDIAVPPGDWRINIAGTTTGRDVTIAAKPDSAPTVTINL